VQLLGNNLQITKLQHIQGEVFCNLFEITTGLKTLEQALTECTTRADYVCSLQRSCVV